MKFLGVKLAINLVFCYFSGILGSTELQTIRIPPHATTNSRCFHRSIEHCHIHCTNTLQRDVAEEVGKLQSKAPPLCLEYRLTIDGIHFENHTMNSFWFTGNGTMLELTIEDFTVAHISSHAFKSPDFVRLRSMKLHGFRVNHLRRGIFTGLDALQVLELNSFDLLLIDAKVLSPCVELHILEIKNSWRMVFSVDGATGAFPMHNLEVITFKGNNFGSTITQKTFVGLVRVQIMDLSRNKITSIGPKSFDEIASTLNWLNLRNNHLTELDGNIFVKMFSQADMRLLAISLDGNRWHCACNLQPMQNFIISHPMVFTGSARCDTPKRWRHHPIQHAILCESSVIVPSNTTAAAFPSTTATTGMTTTTTTTRSPQNQLITLKCMKYFIQNYRTFVSVGMQKQDKVIRLRKTFDKRYTVTIKDFPEDYTVLWYEKAQQEKHSVHHSSLNCFLNRNPDRTQNIKLGDSWRKNKVHTFCMKSKKSLTMTPLNCVSFGTFERIDDAAKMWVPISFRCAAIILMVVACVLCVLLGVGIVFCLARKYTALFDTACSRKKPSDNNDDSAYQKSSDQIKCIEQIYSTPAGCADSRGTHESQFGYIICQIQQQEIPSADESIPPPLPPPHPNQLKRRSQIIKSQSDSEIYCELN